MPRADRLAAATAALLASTVAGCAPWLQGPLARLRRPPARPAPFVAHFERPIPCGPEPYRARQVPGGDDVQIGSLRFLGLGFHYPPTRFRPGAPPLPVPVVVPPYVRATIEVPPERVGVAGLDNGLITVRTGAPARPHRAA